jgi:outer membrane receptor protein involved in Fe transport
MQKVILFILTACLFCLITNAQNRNSISGKITDSISKQGIEYATITLVDAKTNKVLNGATTDSLGYFKLTGIDTGLYNLSFEFIGYIANNLDHIHIKGNHSSQNIGTISLHKTESTLKDVVVTSRLSPLENKIDKIVFNAESDVTSQGGVATDILKKIPQVSVDVDGNVELAGNGGIRFLINGRPSTAFGSNIADVLQSIPAGEIKSIEVMTNPGAKYDAQGMAGIINIILKKSKINGVNGNVSMSVGTRVENGSFNIAMHKGNFGLNAFISGNKRLTAKTPSTSDRITTDSISKEYDLLHQQSEPLTNRYGIQSGVGFDWTFKEHNNLSGNINYNRFGNSGEGIVNQEQKTIPFSNDSVITDIASTNNYENRFLYHSIGAGISYKRTFAKKDRSLEIDASTSLGNNDSRADNYQTLIPQDSVYYGINSNNFSKQNETEIEIDYTQPFSDKINFDAGTHFIFDDITSTSNVYALQPADNIYSYDSLVSNYLFYHQAVYAGYAELSFPVGKLFDAKLGSRYERTEINSYYSNAAQQENAPGYNTLVPAIYFFRKLTANQTLKLSYSKRIQRPGYGDLNPFVNTSDPKNITAGNPYLKPEIGHRVELAYSHDYGNTGSFTITAFYRTTSDDIQPYTIFYPELTVGDTVYTNVSVNTRENIGFEENAGVSFFGSVRATDKLNIRTNMFFFRRHIVNGIDSDFNQISQNYRININGTYQFNKSLVAEFFGNFNSPRNELQAKYPSFTSYTFAARKQLWNRKASIAITATNIFNAYVNQPSVLYGTNFITNSVREVPYRSVGINFTYKFGKLEFKKEKDNNKETNARKESA